MRKKMRAVPRLFLFTLARRAAEADGLCELCTGSIFHAKLLPFEGDFVDWTVVGKSRQSLRW